MSSKRNATVSGSSVMCVTVMYLQRVLSKIVNALCKRAVYTLHRLQVYPQHVVHIVYLQDTHLCNINKVVKQERGKHCTVVFWHRSFGYFLSLYFSLFQRIASDEHGLLLQL